MSNETEAAKLARKIVAEHEQMPHWDQDAALPTLARALLSTPQAEPQIVKQDYDCIAENLYSDAMDSATTLYHLKSREPRDPSDDAETTMRKRLAAGIIAFLKEYPESGLVRLARPPAPLRDGTTVGVQPAARIPSDAQAEPQDEERARALATWVLDELCEDECYYERLTKHFHAEFAAIRAERAAGWRPIAEAPKDGTDMDLWLRSAQSNLPGFRAPDCYWHPSGGWHCRHHEASYIAKYEATHFVLPLPSPPQEGK